jgi:hypothetical protein
MAWRSLTMALTIWGLLLNASVVTAQSSAGRVANPEAVEFDVPDAGGAEIDGYRVELFPTGSDTKSAEPVNALELSSPSSASDGKLRVDIRSSLEGLPDGAYVATIRTLRVDSQSARSEPTQPFLVSHSRFVQDRVVERKERFWTKVGIAIGAGTMIIPFIVR